MKRLNEPKKVDSLSSVENIWTQFSSLANVHCTQKLKLWFVFCVCVLCGFYAIVSINILVVKMGASFYSILLPVLRLKCQTDGCDYGKRINWIDFEKDFDYTNFFFMHEWFWQRISRIFQLFHTEWHWVTEFYFFCFGYAFINVSSQFFSMFCTQIKNKIL